MSQRALEGVCDRLFLALQGKRRERRSARRVDPAPAWASSISVTHLVEPVRLGLGVLELAVPDVLVARAVLQPDADDRRHAHVVPSRLRVVVDL